MSNPLNTFVSTSLSSHSGVDSNRTTSGITNLIATPNPSPTPNPSSSIRLLFQNNRIWRESMIKNDLLFFERLKKQQAPEYLWIGCSDSRVPATQITGLDPGAMFVTRNIANLVIPTDISMLSVLQFAIEVLKVKHIIVCGHYFCGGIKASLENKSFGIIDAWIRHIKDIYCNNESYFNAAKYEYISKYVNEKLNKNIKDGSCVDATSSCNSQCQSPSSPSDDEKFQDIKLNLLVEMNVRQQVLNVAHCSIVQNTFLNNKSQELSIHGFVYDVADGRLIDLGFSIDRSSSITHPIYRVEEEQDSLSPLLYPLHHSYAELHPYL